MTADERIEQLLNHFGETIEDLPKSQGQLPAYSTLHYSSLIKQAENFSENENKSSDLINHKIIQYALHLTDIIDRMEAALDTAERILSQYGCRGCGTSYGPECFEVDAESVSCYTTADSELTGGEEI